ncbi:MAG TPA: hypothetical protein PK590_06480 [Candidatus Omnitrophota bacterium]|nr:hypothetical protein [Candidatus Omnitrophota bacterium]
MKKKKKVRKKSSLNEVLSLYAQVLDLRNHLKETLAKKVRNEDRITDLEIRVNLLTRLLTTLCIERFGFRVATLRRLVKRIESQALRDSQIYELELLYKKSSLTPKKKASLAKENPEDPWRKIS